MTKTHWILLMGMLGLGGGLLTGAPRLDAQEPQSSALLKALPANTTLLVQFNNVGSLTEKIKSSPLYRLKDRDELKPLVQEVENAWRQIRGQIKQELDLELADLLKSCKGEVVVALGDISALAEAMGQALSTFEEPEIEPKNVPLLISVDAQGEKARLGDTLKKFFDYGRSHGARIKEESFHGGKITSVSAPQGQNADLETVYFGEHGRRFFVSISASFLKETFARLASGKAEGSLAESPQFRATHRATRGGGDAFVYLNIKAITSAVDNALSTTMFAFFWQKFQQLFVGKSLNNLGVSTILEPDGIRQLSFIHNDGADDGMLGWLKTQPMGSKPSSLIPGKVLNFSSLGINAERVAQAFGEIFQTVMQFRGQAVDIDTMFEESFQVTFSDLTRSLGNRLHSFQSKAGNVGRTMGDLSFILELKDDGPLSQVVSAVSAMSGGALAPEKYMGRDVYSASTFGPGLEPTLCVTDRMLIFSFEKESAQKVIRRIGKDAPGMSDDAGFRKVAPLLPSKVASMTYTDERYLKDLLAGAAESVEEAAGGDLPKWLVPALNLLGGSFGSGIGYAVWQDDGMYAESWTPYRK
ncbi:MAG: hypothetical protein O7J95_08440 [Planctomycetota bacterium]|nr:hypothetical protein [Planctomycetota bacterium]